MVGSHISTLEQRPMGFNTVRVSEPFHVFACTMGDAFVLVARKADVARVRICVEYSATFDVLNYGSLQVTLIGNRNRESPNSTLSFQDAKQWLFPNGSTTSICLDVSPSTLKTYPPRNTSQLSGKCRSKKATENFLSACPNRRWVL